MGARFNKTSIVALAPAILLLGSLGCQPAGTEAPQEEQAETEMKPPAELNISLAQWSLHRTFFGGPINDFQAFAQAFTSDPDSVLKGTDPADFPAMAAEYGVDTIELVNTFYFSKANDEAYWEEFKRRADEAGVKVGLIMCDLLGDLGDADPERRQAAVENHHPWVDLAAFLGAHTIRVNAAGEGTREEVAQNAAEGLKLLGEYGASKGINVVVENHGGYSSDGSWLAGVIEAVGMDNVGTLPDFGNFCIDRAPDFSCLEEYDRYQGIEELMPWAKAVSAKSNEFDENGNEVSSDFLRIMRIVKAAGYTGDVGIEYEGSQLSEDEGIKATKALLEKVIGQLQDEG